MLEMIIKYYGVDWLAMTMTVLSLFLLGKKKKSGFIYGLGANASWFAFGVLTGSIANLLANIIFAYLNIKGFVNWNKENA